MGYASKDWRHGKRQQGTKVTPKGCKIARIVEAEFTREARKGWAL